MAEFDGVRGGLWEIETPKISGTFAQNLGWVVSTSSPYSRCSSPGADVSKAKPPISNYDGAQFDAIEYWHGYHMAIPGQGSQELLVNHGRTPQPVDGKIYPWTTKQNWRISCLPTITGGTGEGFLAVSPQGTKYFFNRMVTTWGASPLQKTKYCFGYFTGEIHPCPAILPRIEGKLLATRVEDRFGNSVAYNYAASGALTSIVASDGRQITLSYDSAGKLISATDGSRTWLYQYVIGTTSDSSGVLPLLSSVTQPDGQSWTIATKVICCLKI